MQWWFKKFGKRDESLEDEDCSGQLSEVDNNQLRVITEADPHSYKRSCQGTQLQSTTLWSFNIWIKSERQKSSISGFLICWPKTKKSSIWSTVFSYSMQEQWTIYWSDEKWILWLPVTNSSAVGPRRRSKAFPKAKLAPIKGHDHTLWWSAAGLLHYSFLNPGETIISEKYAQQIDEIRWKQQHLQLGLVNKMCPTLLHDNVRPHVAWPMLQKLNELGYEVLSDPPYSPDLLSTHYHFFKHPDDFLQGKHFRNQQEAENACQELIKSLGTDFYATGINKFISHWQNCVDCNSSCFD